MMYDRITNLIIEKSLDEVTGSVGSSRPGRWGDQSASGYGSNSDSSSNPKYDDTIDKTYARVKKLVVGGAKVAGRGLGLADRGLGSAVRVAGKGIKGAWKGGKKVIDTYKAIKSSTPVKVAKAIYRPVATTLRAAKKVSPR